MDLDIPPDQPASVTLLGRHDGHLQIPVRLVSASTREIVMATTPGAIAEGAAVKLACTLYVVLGRVASVHPYEGEDHARLEVRHFLSEADLHVIHQKWF